MTGFTSAFLKKGKTPLQSIYNALDVETIEEGTHDLRKAFVLNKLAWPRHAILDIPGCQELTASGDEWLLSLDSLGTESGTEFAVTVCELGGGVFELQSRLLSIRVERGCVKSLCDQKANREIIPRNSKGNQFVIFDDKPIYWQACDVEVYHLDTREELVSGDTTNRLKDHTASCEFYNNHQNQRQKIHKEHNFSVKCLEVQ